MIAAPPFIKPETWADFTDMRRSMPRSIPFTPAAEKRIIAKLECFYRQGWDVEFILDAAICNGWRGVWVPQGCPKRSLEVEQTQGLLRGYEEAKQHMASPSEVASIVGRVRRRA